MQKRTTSRFKVAIEFECDDIDQLHRQLDQLKKVTANFSDRFETINAGEEILSNITVDDTFTQIRVYKDARTIPTADMSNWQKFEALRQFRLPLNGYVFTMLDEMDRHSAIKVAENLGLEVLNSEICPMIEWHSKSGRFSRARVLPLYNQHGFADGCGWRQTT